jgi:flagellar protein FlgJ
MIPGADLSGKFALDVSSVEALKREARADPDKALRSAAQQFEALLMQMMLKSMREAADVGASTDGQDSKLYKSMLDQQLSIALAKRGIGLALEHESDRQSVVDNAVSGIHRERAAVALHCRVELTSRHLTDA